MTKSEFDRQLTAMNGEKAKAVGEVKARIDAHEERKARLRGQIRLLRAQLSQMDVESHVLSSLLHETALRERGRIRAFIIENGKDPEIGELQSWRHTAGDKALLATLRRRGWKGVLTHPETGRTWDMDYNPDYKETEADDNDR